nr:hypothetical protein [Tanacetum cinerariifolium]
MTKLQNQEALKKMMAVITLMKKMIQAMTQVKTVEVFKKHRTTVMKYPKDYLPERLYISAVVANLLRGLRA